MSRGLVVAAWGAFVVALSAVQFAYSVHPLQFALLAGAGGAAVLVGIALWWTGRRTGPARVAVVELSLPAALAGVAIVMGCLGAEYGLWLILIAAGLFLLAVGGVARELRAERRELEDSR
jgi:hypothetical protein